MSQSSGAGPSVPVSGTSSEAGPSVPVSSTSSDAGPSVPVSSTSSDAGPSVPVSSTSSASDAGPSEPVSSTGGRMKGVVIIKPIVYGNIAHLLAEKREDGHTHKWTVFVKPYQNDDMSRYVKKVQFRLHDSYPNSTRLVVTPPYEVTETGWGEFQVVIKIFFHATEKPVTIYHSLKLFERANTSDSTQEVTNKGIICEHYDEIVFQDPTRLMYYFLTATQPITSGEWTHHTDFEAKKAQTLEYILTAKEKVRAEINSLKERLKLAEETKVKFEEEIAKVLNNQ